MNERMASPSIHNKMKISVKARNAAKYMKKCRQLKHFVKETIFTNAAICDEVVRLENKIGRAKEERRYLLHRLLQQQAVSDTMKIPTGSNSGLAPTLASRPASQSIAQLLGEAEKKRKKSTSKKKSNAEENSVKAAEEGVVPVKASKKSRPNQSKRRVTPIPLDNSGRPIFPIELGSLTIYCLGEIVPLPSYHTTDTIYPVGFCSTRQYLSISKNTSIWLYTCKVSDGGNGAKFEILPEEMPELSFVGTTPSQCHQQLLEAINMSHGPGTVPVDPRGPEFFGLSHPTVQNLIQSCPGARKCSSYRWMKFETSRSDAEVYVEEDASVNHSLIETNRLLQVAHAPSVSQKSCVSIADLDVSGNDSSSASSSLRTLLTT